MVKVLISFGALTAAAVSAGTINEYPPEMAIMMDTTADPCVDFFQYTCGAWYKNTTLLPTKSFIRHAHSVATERNEQVINKILETNKPKLSEFYASCTDTDTLNTLGVSPILKDLTAIRNANTTEAVIRTGARLSKKGVQMFVLPRVSADALDATRNVMWAQQAELPLEKIFYEEPDFWAMLEPHYRTYIGQVFKLAGKPDDEVSAAVDAVIAFERAFAGVQLTKLELMEAAVSNYNPMSFAEASNKYPLSIGLQLQEFDLSTREGCTGNKIILNDLEFFNRTENLLSKMTVNDLKIVIEYKVLNFYAPHLSIDFYTANWKFFEGFFLGRKTPPTRNRFCRDVLDSTVGELLGKYYLEEVWSKEAAERAGVMVNELEKSFNTGLDSADWLDASTRANAKTKLSKLVHLVGGPENPKLYPTLTFDPKSYVDNRNKVAIYDTEFNIAQIDTPVDKRLWGMTAQTFNAKYDPSVNKIVFPAAQLQPPFFSPNADAAQNFGSVGSIVGHEITHGFDNSGRHYDGDGNKKPWWSDNVDKAFVQKAQCIADQYGAMEVISEDTGISLGKLNGQLTLGETIADNGGLKSSFRAYKEYAKTGNSLYTKEMGEKMFFVSFGQQWCEKNRDSSLKIAMKGVHPPGKYRSHGAVQNNDDFARVFSCKVNTPMNPAKKCRLWE